MIRRRDHARYRELIAARLDATLTAPETAELVRHLAECGRCRAGEHAYRAQRQQLRSLRTPPPPRDMWARTSAALDREIARQGGYSPPGRQWRHVLAGGAAVASVAALGLSIGLVGTQQLPVALPQTPGATAPSNARPTPFDVPPEALAFLGSSAQGLTVYRTRVDRVCPAAAIDCMDYDDQLPALVAMPRDMQPSNLALSPNGGRLAIQGRDSSGDDVIAVAVMPADMIGQPVPMDAAATAAATATAAPASPTPIEPAPSAVPRRTHAVIAGASLTPAVAPTEEPSPAVSPEPSAEATIDPAESISSSAAPTLAPAESAEPSAKPQPEPSAEPQPEPSAEPQPEPSGEPQPEPTVEPAASASAPPVEASVTPADPTTLPAEATPGLQSNEPSPVSAAATPDATDRGLASPLAGHEVVAILEDVRSVGAPAAWSADGSALAFSAMPTDGSNGPNVYVWQAGDARARLLTTDHQSYFASWAGSRVVVSRVARPDVGAAVLEPAPEAVTVVIDPLSGEQRTAVGGDGLWLPAINPLGTTLVAWHGLLDWRGNEVAPVSGALYSGEWSQMDPFATGRPADRRPELSLEPIELERDPVTQPVHDWQIRWSPDGHVLGYWIADVPGASWGQLAVIAADRSTGVLDHGQPLLGPSLARRAFTLGQHRVAWVAPADEEPQGELRLMTWGPDGVGGLRLRPLSPR